MATATDNKVLLETDLDNISLKDIPAKNKCNKNSTESADNIDQLTDDEFEALGLGDITDEDAFDDQEDLVASARLRRTLSLSDLKWSARLKYKATKAHVWCYEKSLVAMCMVLFAAEPIFRKF